MIANYETSCERLTIYLISTSCFSFAILRMSSVIFIEQYFGPHMLQK